MTPLVTIGLPIYRRLNYLPQILQVVERQDYPAIELLVSDNGENGSKVQELVEAHYSRPFRFRQNPRTVHIDRHFNQLVEEAAGEYFVMLCDDDEISPNYVSTLVALLERHPEVAVAVSRQEAMDEQGRTVQASRTDLPELIPGDEFIRLRAEHKTTGFRNTVTHLSRTERIRECGGWPVFARSQFSDEALVMRLSVNGFVAFGPECTFRHRAYDESFGMGASCAELAEGSREFLHFLDTDPRVVRFRAEQPERAARILDLLRTHVWTQYLRAWQGRYRERLSYPEWVRAGFALPFIPAYYAQLVAPLLRHSARTALGRAGGRRGVARQA